MKAGMNGEDRVEGGAKNKKEVKTELTEGV